MKAMPDAFRAAGGLLFTVLVAAYGAFAWQEAEVGALAAGEAEGRALLGAVAAGVQSSVAASGAIERLLGDRLIDDAAILAVRLAASSGLEEDVLRRYVEDRGLAGAALLDPELGLVASAQSGEPPGGPESASPFAASRLARLDMDALVARLRAEHLCERESVVVGFEEGPFAARTEFAVALHVPELPGFVVLRADASPLHAFRRDVGITRVLRDASRVPGVASFLVQDAAGVCVAAATPSLIGTVLREAPLDPSWESGPDGRRTLVLSAPVAWEGGPPGHLRACLDAAPIEAVVSKSRRSIAVITAAALAAGAGGLLALSAVERRRRRAEARLRDELAQRERFAAMGRLAAEVAHEIRGPLNALLLHTQLLVRGLAGTGPVGVAAGSVADGHVADGHVADGHVADGRAAELAAPIRDAAARIDAAVQGFLTLGRPDAPAATRPTDLAEVVRHAHASEGGTLDTAPPSAPVVVTCDVRDLATAVANLVRNARQAAPPESVRVAWRTERGEAVLDVDDGGPGVPASRRAEIFEPFKTSRPGGIGIGLSLARDAVERHGGRIEVLDAPGGGARFRVRLPHGGAA